MNTAILFIVTALVNALWQPALIAAIAWVALRVSRCNNATTRHAVWTLALIASAIVPIASALPVVLPHGAPVIQPVSSLPATTKTKAANLPKPTMLTMPIASDAVKQSPAPIVIQRLRFRVQPTIALVAAAVWLSVALVIFGRLLLSFLYLERLKHDALPLAVEARDNFTRYERAGKGDRDVRICVSHEITVPVAVGIFDAMILIPSDFVQELDGNDLDRILLHELAHVRRSDDWVNLFERIAQALFFFSPGIYWVSRQMDLEREVACDDWVLEQSAENVPYARCLARIVEMTQWPYTAPAAPGVFVTRKSMSIRIERLLARGRDIRVRLALVPSLLSLVFIGAVVVGGGFVSPTIAYTLDRTVAQSSARNRANARPTPTPAPKSLEASTKSFVLDNIASKIAAGEAPMAARYAAAHAPQYATKAASDAAARAPEIAAHVAPIAAKNAAAAVQEALGGNDNTNSQISNDGSYLDDLAAAGYKHLSPDEVIEMKSVGVDGAYIRDLQGAGLRNLTPRELVSLKSLGVTGDYVKSMRDAGYGNLTARELSSLKSLGVDGAYMADMRNSGLQGLQIHDFEGLKALGIDADYVKSMRDAGLRNLSVRDVDGLRSLGIDGSYIKELSDAGYTNLDAHQLTELRSLGIDAAYIRALKAHGFNNLTIHDLVRFKAAGVNPQ